MTSCLYFSTSYDWKIVIDPEKRRFVEMLQGIHVWLVEDQLLFQFSEGNQRPERSLQLRFGNIRR